MLIKENDNRNIKSSNKKRRKISTPQTAKELSALIGVQSTIIRKHIKSLRAEGYVKVIAYKKYNVPLWIKLKDYRLIDEKRKDKKINFLKNNQSSTLKISIKLGLGKDRALTYLHQLKEEKKVSYKIKGKTYIWYNEC